MFKTNYFQHSASGNSETFKPLKHQTNHASGGTKPCVESKKRTPVKPKLQKQIEQSCLPIKTNAESIELATNDKDLQTSVSKSTTGCLSGMEPKDTLSLSTAGQC